MSVLAGPIVACYSQGSVTQQKKENGYQANNQHCLQLTSSLFPLVFIFQVFICDPSGNSLNILQPEIFLFLYVFFHYFRNPLPLLLCYPCSLFLLYWLLNHPKVLHIFHFYTILNCSYYPLFSLNAVQLCSLTLQSLTLYIFPRLIQMLSGSLILCDLENISL